MTDAPHPPNRLIHEKSPYLLQHAHNPVDWYPWGKEAFARAQAEDKLLLISIGYATCHWCHVMERESFEDPELAAFLNAHFIPVKVDREERPDVDKLHMDALHALGQQGGWPLNMFVLPDGRPVTGGTYFPPQDLYGRPSFRTILERLAQLWQEQREKLEQVGGEMKEHLSRMVHTVSADQTVPDASAESAMFQQYLQAYDEQHGGFKLQPQNKFPPSMGLQMLLRYYRRTQQEEALTMTEHTLQAMLQGGIYDQIGGGLSRYSTDYQWLVPHFEKMLYDNALFVRALLEAHQVTGKALYASGAQDVLAYLLRDMRHPEGAFYSAEDADSEGVEGKFYVWTPQEVQEVLGSELAEIACVYWDLTPEGNFEGASIPNRPNRMEDVAQGLGLSDEAFIAKLAEARMRLLEHRSRRIRPLCDDKVLTSWNALMISALAHAARALGKPEYADEAVQAARFLFRELMDASGRLLRRWREGEARYQAYLVDYAQLAVACLDLYETTYDLHWFAQAQHLAAEIRRLFHNDAGAYFDTGADAEALLTRSIDGYDGVEPSGNSATAQAFLRLWAYTGDPTYQEDALRIFRYFSQHLERAGVSFGAMLQALHFHQAPPREVVVAGTRGEPETEAMLEVLQKGYYPHLVTAFLPAGDEAAVEAILPLAEGRGTPDGQAIAYVCENFTCQLPVRTAAELKQQLS